MGGNDKIYLFYSAVAAPRCGWTLDAGYSGAFWRPHIFQIMPAGVPSGERTHFALRWLLHRLHLYSHRLYGAFVVRRGRTLVHYSGFRPKYWRFPFMGPADIQIGDTWTHPEHRGKGIARYALQEILRGFTAPGRQFWYVVEHHNAPSTRVAESVGMAVVATGEWTQPASRWGFSSLVINQRVSSSELRFLNDNADARLSSFAHPPQ